MQKPQSLANGVVVTLHWPIALLFEVSGVVEVVWEIMGKHVQLGINYLLDKCKPLSRMVLFRTVALKRRKH
jgi:cobalamin biosynthesis protein CobD/CbiB